ncbi:hypothetical protein [Mammaliicoccus lentus]
MTVFESLAKRVIGNIYIEDKMNVKKEGKELYDNGYECDGNS